MIETVLDELELILDGQLTARGELPVAGDRRARTRAAMMACIEVRVRHRPAVASELMAAGADAVRAALELAFGPPPGIQ